MKKLFYFVALCFLYGSTLLSDDTSENEALSLASLEGEPSSIVHGCVSAITGDYVENQVDLIIPGIEPLYVQRSYCSTSFFDRSMDYGWSLNHHGYLEVNYIEPTVVHDEPNPFFPFGRTKVFGDHTYSVMKDENCSGMQFDCDSYPSKKNTLTVDYDAMRFGVTNCSTGVISARTNWKNTQIHYEDKTFHATTGSGATYHFDKHHRDTAKKDVYRLLTIKKPNRNEITYDYSKHYLTDVKYQNIKGAVLSSFKIDRPKTGKAKEIINITAQDGRNVTYTIFDKRIKGTPSLKVQSTLSPTHTYDYSVSHKHQPSKIIKKTFPKDRVLEIDYYEKDINQIGDEIVRIKSHKDLRLNRVKTLSEPVGTGPELITTCRFVYETGDKGKGSKKPIQGHTKVYDALNHQTIYRYDENHRLTFIEKYKGNQDYQLYTQEKLFWGGRFNSHLCLRTLQNKDGAFLSARSYNYDFYGNILEDVLSGNLTGAFTGNIEILPDSTISPKNERYIKRYTYSKDHLMLSEEDNKIRFEYTYAEGTDLLTAKYVKDKEIIRQRCFYEYDNNGALKVEIIDDGDSLNKNELNHVSERKIKRITNTSQMPIGLPEIVQESYLDLPSQKEWLISKTHNKYNALGQIIKQDLYGNDGKLAYSLEWEYDLKGNVIREVNALGYVTTRQFDTNGNLIKEEGPNKEYYKCFEYDYMNRLIREEIIGKDQRSAKLFKYDYLNNMISSTDSYGNDTDYEYDEFGRVIATIYPAYLDEKGRAIRPKAVKEYNPLGFVRLQKDACGAVTKTLYTLRGQPYRIENPDGTVESSLYGQKGLLLETTAANGIKTKYQMDYLSRVVEKKVISPSGEVQTSTYVYNAFHLISETDPGGFKTIYRYDGAGRPIETLKENKRTTFAYDSLSRLVETREHYDGGYIAHIKAYDLLGRVIEERTEDSNRQLFEKSEYQYDPDGNKILTNVHGEKPAVTHIRYNIHNEPIEILDPLGRCTVTTIDESYRNSLNQCVPCITVTEPDGIMTKTIKDAMGHPVSIIKTDPFGNEIQRQDFIYNSLGRKIRHIETVIASGKNSRKVVTAWEYDPMGHLLKIIEAAGSPLQKITSFVYDNFGQKKAETKQDGSTLHYKYDGLGRLIENYASDKTFHYQYTYDNMNRLKDISDLLDGSKTSRTYNAHSQIISETLSNGLKMQYEYDKLGRPTFVILPDGSKTGYAYDPCRIKKVERFDALGIMQYRHRYEAFDLTGYVKQATLIGYAGTLTQTRDVLSRICSIDTPSWQEQLEYDLSGNLTQKIVNGKSEKFGYDLLHQVKTESKHTYEYDSLFNRIMKDGHTYTLNELNQLKSDGINEYVNDLNGRITYNPTSKIIYTYDAMDRLLSATQGHKQTRYKYDFENRRLSKTHLVYSENQWKQTSVERYFYQGKNEIGLCDVQGKITQLRLLGCGKGAEIGAAVAIELKGHPYAPIHDHNGSVVSLLDIFTGKTVESYDYTAFGEEYVLDPSGQPAEPINPWRYASKRFDEETGLLYFGNRYYDPVIGRWTVPDPIGFDGGMNLYAYVLNNPLILFDLYGHSPVSEASNSPGIFRRMFTNVGKCIRAIGDHVLFIPFIRDTVSQIGHVLAGEKLNNWRTTCRNPSSFNYNSQGDLLSNKTRCLFINGINTSYAESQEAANAISADLGNIRVHVTYNCSRGITLDFFECLAQKLGFPTHSVKIAVENIRAQIEAVGGVGNGGHVLVKAHSQGGLILQRALEQLSPEEKQMLDVVTYGSASIIKDPHLNYVRNYINTSDIVSLCDPINYLKARMFNEEHVKFMKSGPGDYFEHGFLKSKNYSIARKEECERFIKEYGHL